MKRLFQAILLAASVVTAHGQGEAITSFSTSSSGPFAGTAGWAFQPSEPLQVNSLGCLADVITLYGTIGVGLWDSSGAIVASASVAATNELVNASRYVSIAPVVLSSTQLYRIGVFASGTTMFLNYLDSPPQAGDSVTTGIGIGTLSYAYANSGFNFPATRGANNTAIFGANFRYNRTVPEPSSAALFILGSFALLAVRRRT